MRPAVSWPLGLYGEGKVLGELEKGENPAKEEAANDLRGPRAVVAGELMSSDLPAANGEMDDEDFALI